LLYDLFQLSGEPINCWYPEYHNKLNSGKKEDRLSIAMAIRPEWQQQWIESEKNTKIILQKYSQRTVQNTDIMNTYWLTSRFKFKVLERLDRVKKRLDFNTGDALKRKIRDDLRVNKRRRTEKLTKVKPVISKAQKRPQGIHDLNPKRIRTTGLVAGSVFNCETKAPIRRGRRPQRQCWICGYKISHKKVRVFSCCKRESHVKCWELQYDPHVRPHHFEPKCSEVRSYAAKDGSSDLDAHADVAVFDPTIGLECDICGDNLEVAQSDTNEAIDLKKSHYMRVCKGIPGPVLSKDSSHGELSEWIAALGLRKRLGTVDTVSTDLVGAGVNLQDIPRSDHQSRSPPSGGG
jgi:hypothetical protein